MEHTFFKTIQNVLLLESQGVGHFETCGFRRSGQTHETTSFNILCTCVKTAIFDQFCRRAKYFLRVQLTQCFQLMFWLYERRYELRPNRFYDSAASESPVHTLFTRCSFLRLLLITARSCLLPLCLALSLAYLNLYARKLIRGIIYAYSPNSN